MNVVVENNKTLKETIREALLRDEKVTVEFSPEMWGAVLEEIANLEAEGDVEFITSFTRKGTHTQ